MANLDKLDVFSIAQCLVAGESPESLGLKFKRVSAAGFGAFMFGRRIWFTKTQDGWMWGTLSDNGVSAYPSGRINADGKIEKAIPVWNGYVKRDTTSWDGEWQELTQEHIEHYRYILSQ